MLSQKEFVEGCYNWYCEADLQPGNPEDGVWEEAHYPVPKCKGGTETILLLQGHHAIQGVIQSEELQWKCIFGWEKKYLSGEYLELFYKWKSEGQRIYFASKTEEEKILWGEKCRAVHAQMPEETKKRKTEKCRAKIVAYRARMTEEEKILKAEMYGAKTRAYHARKKFNKEVEDLVAVWEMGLRP